MEKLKNTTDAHCNILLDKEQSSNYAYASDLLLKYKHLEAQILLLSYSKLKGECM
jgi:hypothetical protein